MKIMWCGTAGLLFGSKDTIIAFDPFLGMNPKRSWRRKQLKKAFRQVSYVFITHGHFDHIYHIPELYARSGATIFATRTPCRTMIKYGMSGLNLHEIMPGSSIDVGDDIEVTAYQGRHCTFDQPLIQGILTSPKTWLHLPSLLKCLYLLKAYPENREILFYEIKAEGRRIQIMGSMNLDDEEIYPTGADILIFPLQGRSDQDEYALQFVERLRPKEIWLDHYDDAFPPVSSDVDPSGFISNVKQLYGIPVIPMTYGKTVRI